MTPDYTRGFGRFPSLAICARSFRPHSTSPGAQLRNAIAAILATVLGVFRIFAGFSTKKDPQEIKTNVEAIRVQAAATNGRTGRLEEWRTIHESSRTAITPPWRACG